METVASHDPHCPGNRRAEGHASHEPRSPRLDPVLGRSRDIIDRLDGMPPWDVEAERLLLSAALSEPPEWRHAMLRGIAANEFHDPFHAWLYRAMRAYPTAEEMDFLEALLAHPGPDWIRHKLAWRIAAMVYNRAGDWIAGDGDHFRSYRDRIKRAARLRKELDRACEEIVRIFNEAEDTGLIARDP